MSPDEHMEVPRSAIQLMRDPVTKMYNGQALVQMESAQQAGWVKDDLNDMVFSMGYGPRPLEASVAQAGEPISSLLLQMSQVYDYSLDKHQMPIAV